MNNKVCKIIYDIKQNMRIKNKSYVISLEKTRIKTIDLMSESML